MGVLLFVLAAFIYVAVRVAFGGTSAHQARKEFNRITDRLACCGCIGLILLIIVLMALFQWAGPLKYD
jgi:hypothetical protein